MFSIGGFYNSGYGYVSSIEVIDGQTVRIITEEEISVIGGIDLLSKDDSMFNLPIEIRVYN